MRAIAAGMIGETVAHYRILDEIGRGGMGVVYRAEDTKLHRSVALKFIPRQLTHDVHSKERFFKEARTASGLDHPNICTIHEIGEAPDGRLFLVMALYQGETLAEKLQRGPLELDRAVEVCRQLSAGLSWAHESGIVHRDVKPANIFVTRREEVKILDFGLAKLIGDAMLTQPGDVVGTPHYMSPEQAASLEVDARTDIWSVGVVLFEMLAGIRPFRGVQAPQILHSIVYEEPDFRLGALADVPAEVGTVLRRALAKNRNRRYQHLRELTRDLEIASSPNAVAKTVTSASAPVAQLDRAILVLPFANLSPDSESDYFSDGLMDEIITDLSNVHNLRVISRTSAMRLKDTTKQVGQIAEELGVQYVLEGSVRRSGDSLRITAKLIDARSDSSVWADKYRGTLEDVFAIQETISSKIVEALKLKLTDSEVRHLAERPIEDVHAYDCYLKAKQEFLRYSEEGMERAVETLKIGLAATGDNVLLLSALGQVYWQFVNAGISADPAYLDKAKDCASRIVRLDPESPHADRLRGMISLQSGDIQHGVRLLDRVLERHPNDVDTLAVLSPCYGFVGRPYAGLPLAKRLLDIEPLMPMYQALPGILSLMAGAFDRALKPIQTSYNMDPANPVVRFVLGQTLALTGRRQDGCAVFEAFFEESPENFFARLGRFYMHALQDERNEALEAATDEVRATARADLYYSWTVAQGLALVAEPTAAIEWLTAAAERGFINYPLLSKLDPFLDNLRDDDRFRQLMVEVKGRWEAFDV